MPVLQLITALPHTVFTHQRLWKHTATGLLLPLGCVSCEVVHLGPHLTLAGQVSQHEAPAQLPFFFFFHEAVDQRGGHALL